MLTIGKSGDFLFILQGWGTKKELYIPLANELSKKYRVVLFNFPGFNEPLEKPWTLDDYIDWTNNFIKSVTKNSSAQTNLLGHSFGGRVILKALSNKKFDFRIGKIFLVAPAGIKPKRTIQYFFKVYTYKLLKKIKRPLLFLLEILFPFLHEKAQNYYKNAGSDDYKKLDDNMRRTMSNVVNDDLTSILDKIDENIIIIQGENDDAVPLKDVKKMDSLLKHSELKVIKNAGHYPFFDNLIEFYEKLL